MGRQHVRTGSRAMLALCPGLIALTWSDAQQDRDAGEGDGVVG